MSSEENKTKEGRLTKAFSIYALVVVGVFGLLGYAVNSASSSANPNSSADTSGADNSNTQASTDTSGATPISNASNSSKNETTATNSVAPKTVSTNTSANTNTTKTSSVYKDGTYSSQGSYGSPAGTESIGVSVTLKNDIVVSSSVTNEAGDHTSSRYQNMFIGSYQPYVVGKKISTINLGVVGGSSLTPAGFNQALQKIEAQAKA